jgi:hypothetical protein
LTNNSIANVTAYNAAIATGNMVLISSQTASASASISFTTGIDSTYKEYQFWFVNMHPASQSDLVFQGSTDGGSNYGVTITSTCFRAFHYEADNGDGLAYITNSDLAQSTSFQPLIQTTTLGNNADDCLSGSLTIFNPSSTTYVKHFISSASAVEIGNWTSYVAGYFNTTSAINAFQFKMGTGNIDDGTILMFGIK